MRDPNIAHALHQRFEVLEARVAELENKLAAREPAPAEPDDPPLEGLADGAVPQADGASDALDDLQESEAM